MLSETRVNIQNIEFPKSRPLTYTETPIDRKVNFYIVLIICERIRRPLLVPVSFDTVQLFTKK